jgi:predicted nucleic acid-binding protein
LRRSGDKEMYYLDTSIIISYLCSNEDKHDIVSKFLHKIRNKDIYTSTYTIIETTNTLCRIAYEYERSGKRFIEPLNSLVKQVKDPEARCKVILGFVIEFLTKTLGANIIDDPQNYQFVELVTRVGLKVPKLFKVAIELSPKVRLRIKDLLHIAYAYMLAQYYRIRYFITLDVKDFTNVIQDMKRYLNIDVIILHLYQTDY